MQTKILAQNDFWICDALFIQSETKDNSFIYDYNLLLSASVLQAEKIAVKYIEKSKLNNFSLLTRRMIIKNYNPKIIFINVGYKNYKHAVNLAKELKSFITVPIVAISNTTDIDLFERCFDFYIKSSNEKSPFELYNCLIKKIGNLKYISGIAYYDHDILVNNPSTYSPEEISQTDFSLFPPGVYVTYHSSRSYNGKVVLKKAETISSDILDIVKTYGCKHIEIIDSDFMSDYNRLNDICDLLSRSELDFKISCPANFEILYKYPDIVEKFAKAHICLLKVELKNNIDKTEMKKIKKSVLNVTSQKNICVLIEVIIDSIAHAQKDSRYIDFLKNMIIENNGLFIAYPVIKNTQFKSENTINIFSAFSKEIEPVLWEVLKKAKFDILMFYNLLNEQYGIFTSASIVLNSVFLKKYFKYFNRSMFKRLENIFSDQLNYWIPFRILPDFECILTDNGYELDGYYCKLFITDPFEISIYEYSAGKLNVEDIAKRICNELDYKAGHENFIKEVMVPFYKKLEDNYQIIFYR